MNRHLIQCVVLEWVPHQNLSFFFLFFGGLFVLNGTVVVLEHLMKFEEKAPVLRTHTVKY